jgi:hypothetical protein
MVTQRLLDGLYKRFFSLIDRHSDLFLEQRPHLFKKQEDSIRFFYPDTPFQHRPTEDIVREMRQVDREIDKVVDTILSYTTEPAELVLFDLDK